MRLLERLDKKVFNEPVLAISGVQKVWVSAQETRCELGSDRIAVRRWLQFWVRAENVLGFGLHFFLFWCLDKRALDPLRHLGHCVYKFFRTQVSDHDPGVFVGLGVE